MKKVIFAAVIILATTNLFAQKPKEVIHYNIVFAPDLSNRLNPVTYPKAVNDADIVDSVLKNIWPILRWKRDRDQLDHYHVDFINKGLIGLYKINTEVLDIDFQKFIRQSDRVNYALARNNVSKTLAKDVSAFSAEYRKFNSKAAKSNNGADIWSYFQSGIDDRVVFPSVVKGKVTHRFRNIIILFTDGYIEAGIFNKGFDLGSTKIASFRKAFLKSKEQSMEMFLAKNRNYKINPVQNPYLKNIEVIVMEMYDRSLSKTGAATTHPTDMEIMKVIWSDWLKSSGIPRFELKVAASSKDEAKKYILNFIKN